MKNSIKLMSASFAAVCLVQCAPSDTVDRSYDADAVLSLVERLSDDALEGREAGTAGGALAREMIVERMKAVGLSQVEGAYEFTFNVIEPPVEGINLVGMIEGKSDDVIVLTAHYDHLGIRNGEIYNGMDDNASGVGALMAIAELYSGATQPEHSLLFVFFDAEEKSLTGARAFLQSPPIPVERMVFNLNLDMVSRADNGELWASGVSHLAGLGPVLEDVSKSAPLDLKMGYDGSIEGQDDWTSMSDHGVFFDAGIPHLYLGVQDHPDYHKPSDDFENIDPDVYLKSIDTIVMVFEALDARMVEILGE